MFEFDLATALIEIGKELKLHDRTLVLRSTYKTLKVSDTSLIHYTFSRYEDDIKNTFMKHFPDELIYCWQFRTYPEASDALKTILEHITEEVPYLPTLADSHKPHWLGLIIVPTIQQ